MAQNPRLHEVLRTAFVSIWGVLTLVLLFTVVFLVFQLSETKEQIDLGTGSRATVVSVPGEAAVTGRPVTLYFADAERIGLAMESRPLPLTESTVENCRAAFVALAEGPRAGAVPVMPAGARARAMYLLDSGELVVDLSREVESPQTRSASAEWLLVQSIVHTLAQPALQGQSGQDRARPVTSVRLLFEGSPLAESFPSHIALTQSLRPDPALLGGE